MDLEREIGLPKAEAKTNDIIAKQGHTRHFVLVCTFILCTVMTLDRVNRHER